MKESFENRVSLRKGAGRQISLSEDEAAAAACGMDRPASEIPPGNEKHSKQHRCGKHPHRLRTAGASSSVWYSGLNNTFFPTGGRPDAALRFLAEYNQKFGIDVRFLLR